MAIEDLATSWRSWELEALLLDEQRDAAPTDLRVHPRTFHWIREVLTP